MRIDIWFVDITSGKEQLYDDNSGEGYSRDGAYEKIQWLKKHMKVKGKRYYPIDRDFEPLRPPIKEGSFTIEIHPEYIGNTYRDGPEEYVDLLNDDDYEDDFFDEFF